MELAQLAKIKLGRRWRCNRWVPVMISIAMIVRKWPCSW